VSQPVDRDLPTFTSGPESAQPAEQDRLPPRARAPAPLQYRDAGRYAIEGEHARGGLGRILRARDLELGRPVAVKELLKRTEVGELRFYQEALITARLEHPNIVPVHEAGRWSDGTPFYAMKLVAGRSLREMVEVATTTASRHQLIEHVASVADAIAYAHARGVIHRDIKPANVIIGHYGETIVVDWGLAKYIGDSDARVVSEHKGREGGELTADGSVLGTPAFMAPEQTQSAAGPRSDIYSLGAMLFNVVTGRLPSPTEFPSRKELEVVDSADMRAIIVRATARIPSDRYETAADFAADVRRFLQRQPVKARKYGLFSKLPLAVARNQRLTLGLLVFLALTSLVMGATTAKVSRARLRAATSEQKAVAAQTVAETSLAESILARAQTLVGTDPSQTLALLDAYKGTNRQQAMLVSATAKSNGVSSSAVQIHADSVHFLERTEDGTVLSWSADGAISFTRSSGFVTYSAKASRHTPPVYSSLSNSLAVASASNQIVVRNPQGAALTRVETRGAVASLDLSPDGSVLATADALGFVEVWRKGRSLLAVDTGARWVALPNNDHIITGHDNLIVSVSLLDTNRTIRRLMSSRIMSGDEDPSGGTVYFGLEDGAIVRLAAEDLRLISTIRACTHAVRVLDVNPGGFISYACADEAALTTADGRVLAQTRCTGACISVGASSDARYLVAGDESGRVHARDLLIGEARELRGHQAPVTAVLAPMPGEREIVSADAKGELRRWQVLDARSSVLATLPDGASTIAFTPDGGSLVVGARGNAVYAVNIHVPGCQSLPKSQGSVFRLLVTAHYFATLGTKGTAAAWRWPGLDNLGALDIGAPITDLDRTPNGSLLASSENGSLIEWNPVTGDVWNRRDGGDSIVSMDAMGENAVFSTIDGRVWSREGGVEKPVAEPSPSSTFVRGSATGQLAVFGRANGELLVYRPGWRRSLQFFTMPHAVYHIEISPDDRYVAVSTEGDSLALFLLEPFPHSVFVVRFAASRRVAFDPLGQWLAATGTNGEIRFYSLASNAWSVTRPHEGRVQGGAFDASGQLFASVGQADKVVLTRTDMLMSGEDCGHRCSRVPQVCRR
jgi:serine/threonine protein kinase